MHALIVIAHPNPQSLTHSVATQIIRGFSAANKDGTSEIADLAAEGFDPRFTAQDISTLHRETEPSAEVIAEQQRISRADALVLVHPVYWWSFPALLKGWIDRVFTNGWAYDDTSSDRLIKKMQHLPVHIVSIAGSDVRTYMKHGYIEAMKTQIDHGIFDYCGAPVLTSELLFQSDPDMCLKSGEFIGKNLLGSWSSKKYS